MAEGIQLIPKRKLSLLSADDGANSTIEHLAEIAVEQVVNNFNWDAKGTEPHVRLSETDQVDPAGRFQLRVFDGDFAIEKAASAAWASVNKIFHFDTSSSTTALYNIGATSGFLYLDGNILAGDGASLALHGATSSGNEGALVFATPNAATSANVTRLTISGVTATADITVGTANLKMGTNLFYVASIVGDGTNNITMQPNNATTNSTERTMTFRLLDATGDAWKDMITMTPNAAAPTMDFNSRPISNITPSTTGGSSVVASYGPAAVASITVVNGLITAIS